MRFLLSLLIMLSAPVASAQEFTIQRLASPRPSFELFRSVCADNNAVRSEVAGALRAREWLSVALDEYGTEPAFALARGFTMHWASFEIWRQPDTASHVFVAVGDGLVGEGTARGEFCLVGDDASFSRQLQAVRSWLRFRSAQSWGSGGEVFAYLRGADGSVGNGSGLSEDMRRAAMGEGRFGFVQVIGGAEGSALLLSVIRPAEPTRLH